MKEQGSNEKTRTVQSPQSGVKNRALQRSNNTGAPQEEKIRHSDLYKWFGDFLSEWEDSGALIEDGAYILARQFEGFSSSERQIPLPVPKTLLSDYLKVPSRW